NLSKPEKDPMSFAAATIAEASNYPKCVLCMENEGYQCRINHPARANHRIIRLDLGQEKWSLQYSPYAYYNEHAIFLN
ncbi:UDP-glucose--hexose-1-phosphate uridylyltransferase, partial [Streptococcus suis]